MQRAAGCFGVDYDCAFVLDDMGFMFLELFNTASYIYRAVCDRTKFAVDSGKFRQHIHLPYRQKPQVLK